MKSTQLKPFIYKDLRLKMSKCQFFAQNIQKYFFLIILYTISSLPPPVAHVSTRVLTRCETWTLVGLAFVIINNNHYLSTPQLSLLSMLLPRIILISITGPFTVCPHIFKCLSSQDGSSLCPRLICSFIPPNAFFINLDVFSPSRQTALFALA